MAQNSEVKWLLYSRVITTLKQLKQFPKSMVILVVLKILTISGGDGEMAYFHPVYRSIN